MKTDEKEITLESLVGKHFLTGVDYGNEPVKSEYSDDTEDSAVIRFRLDGKTYQAIEDPDDGYRSMMRSLKITKDTIKNKFSKIQVVGIYRYCKSDIIEFYDVETGKCVLEVGTSNTDDYYPSFVARFSPENMIINKSKTKV